MNGRGVLWACLCSYGLLAAAMTPSLANGALTLDEDLTLEALKRLLDESVSTLSIHGVGNPTRNSCSEIDLSTLELGRTCGSPLGQPCFDMSRCVPVSQGGPGPTIYVYDHDCTLKKSSELGFATEVDNGRMLSPIWRDAARDLGVLAEEYDTACAFIEVNMRLPKDPPCATKSPLWNNGKNHLILDFTDSSR